MNNSSIVIRKNLFNRIRKGHNSFVGLIALTIFIAFVLVQFSYFRNYYDILRKFYDSILILDCSFILIVVLMLPKNNVERAIVVNLNKPIIFLLFSLMALSAIVSVVKNEPFIVLWSLSTYLFIIFPLLILDIGRNVFWKFDEEGRLPSEGEQIYEILSFLTNGGSFCSFLFGAYWCRKLYYIGFTNIRIDMLILIALQIPLFLMSWIINIRYNYQEKPYSDFNSIFASILTIVVAVSTIYVFPQLDDWQTFQFEIIGIYLIYTSLLFPAISILHRWNSKILLIGLISIITPVYLFFLFKFAQDIRVIGDLGKLIVANSQYFISGLSWLLGAFAGSALFSLCLWLLRRRRGQFNKKCINSATRQSILSVLGISERLAEDIIKNRPYTSIDQIHECINGIGPKKLSELKKRFMVI